MTTRPRQKLVTLALGLSLSFLAPARCGYGGQRTFYPAYVAPQCFDDFEFQCNLFQPICASVTPSADESLSILFAADPHAIDCLRKILPPPSHCAEASAVLAGETVEVCLPHLAQGHVRVFCSGPACPAAYRLDITCPLTARPNTKQAAGRFCP